MSIQESWNSVNFFIVSGKERMRRTPTISNEASSINKNHGTVNIHELVSHHEVNVIETLELLEFLNELFKLICCILCHARFWMGLMPLL